MVNTDRCQPFLPFVLSNEENIMNEKVMGRQRASGDSNEEVLKKVPFHTTKERHFILFVSIQLIANLKRQGVIKSDAVERAMIKIPRGVRCFDITFCMFIHFNARLDICARGDAR